MRRLLGACLIALSLLAPLRASEVVAVVVEVKGQATVKTDSDPPSRLGTQLKLLAGVEDGRHIRVAEGGRVTLSFTRGGVRSTLVGPVEGVVHKDGVVKQADGKGTVTTPKAEQRQAKLAPRTSMDLSRMGGVNARAICNVWTDQSRPWLALDLIRQNRDSFNPPKGAVKVFYRDLGSSTGEHRGEWTEASAEVNKDDFVVPSWDLKPDHSYSINLLTQPADSNQAIDYSVRVFKPDALIDLNEAISLADKPGPDFEVRQVTLIQMLDQYHLYDKALARAMALSEKHPGEASLRELVLYLHEEKLQGEGGAR